MAGMPGDVVKQRVLFMRHPETVSNVEHFFSGRMDVALTENGRKQAERGIEALVAFAPDRIFTSPLSRARDMAEEAARRLGVTCTPLDDLLEIDFGPLEGLSSAHAVEDGLSFPWPIDEAGRSCPPAGAESFEEVIARCKAVLDLLMPLEGKTALVTHGGYQRFLMAALYDIPFRRLWDMHILNVSSLFLTCDGERLCMGGFNLAPEEVISHSTQPNEYDTRDIWGAGRKEIA